ncbi:fanconi-associated nuclease 1 isoform X2 [Latimeria chalumnae]|uniref:Fanconi-associated nuclease n=1 Tax=Latimeria chalumnae TaxID=7897 RepID=M3XI33_LATCH
MSEARSPEKKRPRRSLSLSKNKKNVRVKNKAVPSKSDATNPHSILSFFNNAPPAKVACPACGEVVPRFWINEHMDEACQKKSSVCDDVILVSSINVKSFEKSSPQSPKVPPSQVINTKTTKISTTQISGASSKEIASPYFKKSGLTHKAQDDQRGKAVKTISLGSLSSKLSRKYHRQVNTLNVQKVESHSATSAPNKEEEGIMEQIENVSLNSSQKENQFVEVSEKNCKNIKEKRTRNVASIGGFEMMEFTTALECEGEDGLPQVCEKVKSTSASQTDTRSEVLFPLSRSTSSPGASVSSVPEQSVTQKHDDCKISSVLLRDNCEISSDHHDKDDCFEISQETRKMPQGNTSLLNSNESSSTEALPIRELDDLENDFDSERFGGSLEETGCSLNVEADSQNVNRAVILANESSSNDGSISGTSRHPYYLCNFLMVLQTVMNHEDDRQLFNEKEIKNINKFHQLSAAGQKLYVRLFQRKLNWIKVNKLEYTEIGSDLVPVIEELVQADLLQTESELQDISEMLDLLSAPEMKTLAKAFHLANPSGLKQQLVEDFLHLAKQRSIFSFSKNQLGVGASILKRGKELAGKCVRVCRGPRAVFSRVLLLFSLTDSMEDEEAASGGQSQLFTVLMVNMGRVAFPSYNVTRRAKNFQDREDLIRYETAMHMLIDVTTSMVNGKWEEAHLLYKVAKEAWLELRSSSCLRYHEKLPVYLRCFTVGWVYTRILSRGVEILQRLRMYEEAVEELQGLLSQNVYCLDSRGRWWDRLALNLHQHLKHTEKAIMCIREGLSDSLVRTGHQLSLYQRALRMRDSPRCKKFHRLLLDLPAIQVEDVTHVTIKGKMFPQMGVGKSVFLMVGDEESSDDNSLSTVMCSVEELAIAHYRQQGFDQGIHGEGSTFSTLYGLLMWDIIFLDGIPDVFRNPYQAYPLDLYTDSFYENRKDAIESRLQLLQDASNEILKEKIAEIWSTQQGKVNTLVSWERFTSLQQAQGLASCFGGPFLSGVCWRLAKDLRHCRGGLPDLVVWNTQNNSYKVVEVKGPNDRLSHKQMIWLDELRRLGAEVEVCHVTAIGAKSARLS